MPHSAAEDINDVIEIHVELTGPLPGRQGAIDPRCPQIGCDFEVPFLS